MKLATLEVADYYLNHPQIKPHHGIAQDKAVSLAPVWMDVVCFEFGSGCIAFHKREPGVWEEHLMMVPNAGNPYRCNRKALTAMFRRPDCACVIGRIPQENKKAIRLAGLLGFKDNGVRDGYAHFSMTKEGAGNELDRGDH